MEKLREEFLRLLTQDSETVDLRRRDYNRAIFAPSQEGGFAILTRTTLNMIMQKFDRAMENLKDADSAGI